mmetsp:Transcript_36198/g.90941  ORF Transcript_36198/g.90941 Transcript_36198/m.90941 type:complete len:352 (+) Transcript_36198:431-1486(+)
MSLRLDTSSSPARTSLRALTSLSLRRQRSARQVSTRPSVAVCSCTSSSCFSRTAKCELSCRLAMLASRPLSWRRRLLFSSCSFPRSCSLRISWLRTHASLLRTWFTSSCSLARLALTSVVELISRSAVRSCVMVASCSIWLRFSLTVCSSSSLERCWHSASDASASMDAFLCFSSCSCSLSASCWLRPPSRRSLYSLFVSITECSSDAESVSCFSTSPSRALISTSLCDARSAFLAASSARFFALDSSTRSFTSSATSSGWLPLEGGAAPEARRLRSSCRLSSRCFAVSCISSNTCLVRSAVSSRRLSTSSSRITASADSSSRLRASRCSAPCFSTSISYALQGTEASSSR